MPETLSSRSTAPAGVMAHWQLPQVLNLRGNPDDPAFATAVQQVLGVALPTVCGTSGDDSLRLVWAGPDDWFILSAERPAATLAAELRAALQGQHVAITDVTGGYTVLRLTGPAVRELLAQGCPLDLHPDVFRTGQSAGSVFFKASVWLWLTAPAPTFEVLVRSSFKGYVQLLVERCTLETGLDWQQAA